MWERERERKRGRERVSERERPKAGNEFIEVDAHCFHISFSSHY